MPRSTADLKAIVAAVEFRSAGGIAVLGEAVSAATKGDDDGAAEVRLAAALYQRLYCRPQAGGFGSRPDPRAIRIFVEQLSRANCGRGTWEPGWTVRALERDGTLVVHKAVNDLTLWASPAQFRPAQGSTAVGSTGRLFLGKEMREMLPGYYMAVGDTDQRGDETDLARFYWHLTAAGAGLWVGELTRRFNAAGLAFHAKVISDPSAYLRADAGVLYVAQADLTRALELLPVVHHAVSALLRPSTPMFTRRLARGLAAADDPGQGQSFGQHRCGLVAEALLGALASNKTEPRDVGAAIAGRFTEAGLAIARPWLAAGSLNAYSWQPAESPPQTVSVA